MRALRWLLLAVPLAAQPPAINQEGVRNAASLMPTSLAGAGIARGARFVVLGLRFGADASAVRVRVLSGGASLPARVLSVGNNQMEALMPAGAALGDATLVVNNPDGDSRPFRLRVTQSSPGLYHGPLSFAPGEAAAVLATGIDLRTPVQIFVGGIKAVVRGMDPAEAGTYRIRFETPRAAPLGCFVPMYARDAEGHVSNSVSMEVHQPGRACDGGSFWPFANMPAGGTGALVGLVRVKLSFSAQGKPVRTVGDTGFAAFLSADAGERPFSARDFLPAPGTCRIDTELSQPGVIPTLPTVLLTLGKPAGLSAGPFLTVGGVRGEVELPPVPDAAGIYSGTLGGEFPGDARRKHLPLFLGSEETVVSAPGRTVGAFRVSLPALPVLDWPQQERLQSVDRARGVTLEWSADAPVVFVAVNVDQQTTAMTTAVCQPAARARRFTFSPDVLANFPATAKDALLPMGWVGLVTLPGGKGVPITAAGIDTGYGMTLSMIARGVAFR